MQCLYSNYKWYFGLKMTRHKMKYFGIQRMKWSWECDIIIFQYQENDLVLFICLFAGSDINSQLWMDSRKKFLNLHTVDLFIVFQILSLQKHFGAFLIQHSKNKFIKTVTKEDLKFVQVIIIEKVWLKYCLVYDMH